MANLHAQLMSPDRVIFDGEIRSVMLPGVEGDMTVFAGHQSLMTMLHPGVVFAIDAGGTGRRAYVRGAYAEITATSVTILAEEVVAFEELTLERIDEEILQLQMRRDGSSDGLERARHDASISRLETLKGNLNL